MGEAALPGLVLCCLKEGWQKKNPYFPLYLHDFPVNVSFYFSKYREVPSGSRCGIFEILSSYQKRGGVRLDNRDICFPVKSEMMVHPDSSQVLRCSGTCCGCSRGGCFLKAGCCC